MTIANFSIYGHVVACRVLAVHPLGTYDVERLSDGQCFRVSGLPLVSFKVVDLHTGAVVGRSKTLAGASRSAERRNLAYGAHRFTHRRITE